MWTPLLLSLSALPATAAGRVVIDFTDGTTLPEARRVSGLSDLEWVHERSADESLAVATVPDPSEVVARLAEQPGIEAVEEPVRVEALGFPDDPLFDQQWNLRAIGVARGWRAGGGGGVTVAVIDTGVTRVADLEETLILDGFSFVEGEPTAEDGNGHGTHVAGTIAQSTHNGLGVAGIAPQARILPIKALSRHGFGMSPWIASAIDEAVDQGAQVINLSLGGARSDVIAVATEKAVAAGVLVIAAAGNTGQEGVSYPGALPGVLGVSAVGPKDELAPYSSWGAGVALSAPGGDKRSPGGGILQDTVDGAGSHAFKEFQGTSMATPHVAGAAAVLLSASGGDRALTQRLLLEQAVDLGEPGPDPRYGHGRLDLAAAVGALAVRRNGLLFALGAMAAAVLTGIGAGRRRGRALVIAATSALAAGGAFVLPLLPLPPSALTGLLARPLLLWPAAMLPDPYWRNPLLLSAALPFLLTFFLGPTRTLGPIAAGVSAGIATHLAFGAVTGALDVWLLPGPLGSAWLGLHAGLSALCAMAAIGVARLRDKEGAP